MAEIILLRHGQASFGEANYDQLSSVGFQQSRWVGEHFHSLGKHFDHVARGTLLRHQQTADSMLEGMHLAEQPVADVSVLPGLDEFSFSTIVSPLHKRYPQQWVDTGQPQYDYYKNMLFAMQLWMDDRLDADIECESWQDFRHRVMSAFRLIVDNGHQKQLVVTSGGPIAIILADIMGLDEHRLRSKLLQIKNSSYSRILYNRRQFTLDSFNEIPHLLTPERQHAITFA